MNADARERLEAAVCGALEGLAFVFATPIDEPVLTGSHQAIVCFRGPLSGAVCVQADADALASIAANMLGSEEPPALPVQQDALGEVANVITGNLLREAGPADGVFDLTPPRMQQEVPGRRAARVTVATEPGELTAILYLEGSPQ
jgi:hypothetical protein